MRAGRYRAGGRAGVLRSRLRPLRTLAVSALAWLAGCASTPELLVAPEDWVYEERAISIELDAPSDLNARAGRPHAIAIGVFQLNDPNTFSGLAATREGAVELLGKGRIDDTVADFRLINVQPGERKTVVFARAQTAQFVGLIVGYFRLTPRQDVHVFNIPVVASDRGLVDLALSKVGLVADEAKAKPGRLSLRIDLGRAGTQQVVKMEPSE